MQTTVVGTCPFPSLPPHGVHPSRYEVVKRGYAKCFKRGGVDVTEDCTILPFPLSFPPSQPTLLNLHVYLQTDMDLWVCLQQDPPCSLGFCVCSM